MNVDFKVADAKDVEGIVRLCNECFEENTTISYAKRIFEENKLDVNQIYVIGVLNGEIVAHAKVNVIPTIYEDMNTYAILNHVCVRPDLRRGHIGTKLMDACFAIAKEHHCKCVELWSKNFRIAAHGLYHKYGFEVVDAKFFSKDVK